MGRKKGAERLISLVKQANIVGDMAKIRAAPLSALRGVKVYLIGNSCIYNRDNDREAALAYLLWVEGVGYSINTLRCGYAHMTDRRELRIQIPIIPVN